MLRASLAKTANKMYRKASGLNICSLPLIMPEIRNHPFRRLLPTEWDNRITLETKDVNDTV